MFLHMLLHKVPWRIVGGIAVATPAVGIVQGAFLLYEYRRNHGDAPVPFSPSRGLVVAHETHGSPLRLLVIGDSLAAGVGTSQSSTPILPTSIAKVMSEATGRPVEWLCKGVPGQSSDRIVSDITNLDAHPPFSQIFVQRVDDFQKEQRARFEIAKAKTQEWLELRHAEHDAIEEQESAKKNIIIRWWNITIAKVTRDYQRVRQILKETQTAQVLPHEQQVPTQQRLVRRRTIVLDPEVIARYDVAVVFTGANDLKEAYLPFMMPPKDNGSSSEESSSGGDLVDQFVRILHALESKMRVGIALGQPATATAIAQFGGPLVVFPALPYEPTILNRLAPLSWFLIPLLKMVDRSKQRLAELYPDRVLFVEPPDLHDESIHLTANPPFISLHDIQQDVKRNVEQLMRQHYDEFATESDEDPYLYELHEDDVRFSPVVPKLPDVVSVDGIHPSDRGYNAWGKHIGEAIAAEFRRRRRLAVDRLDMKQVQRTR